MQLHLLIIFLLAIITVDCTEKASEMTTVIKDKSSPPRQQPQPRQTSPKRHSKESLADWAKMEPIHPTHTGKDQQLKSINKAPLLRLDDGASAARKVLQSQKDSHNHNQTSPH